MVKVQTNSQGKVYLANNKALLAPELTTKNITQNGTYNASSDSADGYSSVTVNVSGSSGKYQLLDRVKDDSNNEIGTVSGFFTDANNTEYAVVCLDAQYRDQSGGWSSTLGEVTGLPVNSLWTDKNTATFNTQKIIDWCTTNGYTSGMCTKARNLSFVIDGITYYGQVPNRSELWDICNHYTEIDAADTSASSYDYNTLSEFLAHTVIVSSSQNNANACWVGNSATISTNSKNANMLAPVLEIPNS